MAYVIVNGNNNNNNMLNFVGILNTAFSQVFVNPYDGYTITITGTKNVNNGIYDGMAGTNDTLNMTANGDIITLTDSAGTIMVKNLERIQGLDGDDVIILSDATQTYGALNLRGSLGDDILWSNNGDDFLFGQQDDDLLHGGGGNDHLYGGDQNDILIGGLGADSLFGGAGDDTLHFGADAIWTGGVMLSDLNTTIPFANLVNLDGYNQSHDLFHGDGTESYLSPVLVTGFDTLIMTDGNDALILGDVLSPEGVITPRVQYMDYIKAGAGNDIVDMSGAASVGPVSMDGGTGDDILGGTIYGEELIGGEGNDRLYGNAGSDNLYGGTGNDAYYYNLGDGIDSITETSGTDSIVFGAGITLASLTFTIDGPNLILSLAGGSITIMDHFAADFSGRVESLVFDDGSTYDIGNYTAAEPPVAGDDAFAGDEDTVITGNVLGNDTDGNGDTLSVVAQALTTANGGSVTINADGSFSYQGAANFNGSDTFNYTVEDGNGGTDTGTVSLTINAVNDAPLATDKSFSGDEDTVITGNVLAGNTDIDGDVLTAVAQTLTTANGGSVTINADGTFSYEGAPNFNGSDSFDYKVVDGKGGFDIGTISLTIDAVNDAPVAGDNSFTGDEDATITGSLLGNDTDADGDTLTAVAQTLTTANGGSVTINTDGTFSYQGAANYNGSDSFDYTVEDGKGGADTATVSLTVNAVNDAPVATDKAFSGDEDTVITGNVLAGNTDVDGDVLTAVAQTLTTGNGGSVIINADGTFSYQGAANFHGADSFDYKVVDGKGGFDTATVSLTISAVNDAPVAIDDAFSGSEDALITGNLLGNDTDVDGDTLSAAVQTFTTANGGAVTINADGTFSYQGAANYNGSDSFSYTVTDGKGGSDTGTVSINLDAVNNAPVAVDDVFAGHEDAPVTGNLLSNDSDVDGDTLSVLPQTFTTTKGGTVSLNANGTFSYIGAANFNGTDSFDYTVRDGAGAVDTGHVTLSIAAVNDAPVAQDDSFTIERAHTLTGSLLANNGKGADSDIDDDILALVPQTLTTVNGGKITVNADGTFSYKGSNSFFGTDSFEYTVTDGKGGADTGLVKINVTHDTAYNTVLGSSAGQTTNGTAGNDAIYGQGGNDTVYGKNGNDQLFGGSGNDTLYGDSGVPATTTIDKVFGGNVVPVIKQGADITTYGAAALGIAQGNLNVSYDATASITFRASGAAYDNSLGSFAIASDGTLVNASMHWANVKAAGTNVTHQIDLPTGAEGGNYGFFVIADGNDVNGGYAGLNITGAGNISFVYDYGKSTERAAKITDSGARISAIYDNGVTEKVLKGNVYFTTERGGSTAINKDGKVHVVSGLIDTNDRVLGIKKADLASNPVTFTKNGITLEATTGKLGAQGDRVGVVTTGGPSDVISGKEGVRASFAGSESVLVSLGNLKGEGRAIDFKIYVQGVTNPIDYEYVISGVPANGKADVLLNASSFGGGLITSIVMQSLANSAHGTELFWINDIKANVPGGVSTDSLRIGFEDLHNLGDKDYDDVLFDLNINPGTVTTNTGGNDYLDGGSGDDVMYGEGGDDILVIGRGMDTATGGAGADTFVLSSIDNVRDTITDFKAAEGDKINITDVLEGYDPLTDDISHFVRLVQSGADTELQINADGAGSDFVAAALIRGGVGGETLADLVADGVIVTNQNLM